MLIAIIALVVAGMLFWLWRRSGRAVVLVAAIVWLAYPLWEFALQIFAPRSTSGSTFSSSIRSC